MTDFFKPVAAKQSAPYGKTEDGTQQDMPTDPVLQSIPNGHPRMPAASHKTKAPMAKPRRPVTVNGSQPEAKRQRTLGVSAATQHGGQGPRDGRAAQPAAHGASVIDISVSDVTAAARDPAAAQDTVAASAAEDVSLQQPKHARCDASPSAVDRGAPANGDAAAAERRQDAAPAAAGLDGCLARREAPSNGSCPVSANRSDDNLTALEALGFSRSRAQMALSRCCNDVERAANLLFSGVT